MIMRPNVRQGLGASLASKGTLLTLLLYLLSSCESTTWVRVVPAKSPNTSSPVAVVYGPLTLNKNGKSGRISTPAGDMHPPGVFLRLDDLALETYERYDLAYFKFGGRSLGKNELNFAFLPSGSYSMLGIEYGWSIEYEPIVDDFNIVVEDNQSLVIPALYRLDVPKLNKEKSEQGANFTVNCDKKATFKNKNHRKLNSLWSSVLCESGVQIGSRGSKIEAEAEAIRQDLLRIYRGKTVDEYQEDLPANFATSGFSQVALIKKKWEDRYYIRAHFYNEFNEGDVRELLLRRNVKLGEIVYMDLSDVSISLK